MNAEASVLETPGRALPVVLWASSQTMTSKSGTPRTWAARTTSIDWYVEKMTTRPSGFASRLAS